MKKIIIAAVALGISAIAFAQSSSISYSLPKTCIHLKVSAERELFQAGPYAAYAKKYLGIEAMAEDKESTRLLSVEMFPTTEADRDTLYSFNLYDGQTCPEILKLTSQGLIAGEESHRNVQWSFSLPRQEDLGKRGLTETFTSKEATLYSQRTKAAVHQNITVAKTTEQKAKEAADMIFLMRKTRVQIITGDTDATYSGEAMEAALSEIDKIEKEYTSLFLGSKATSTQTAEFEVIPSKANKSRLYVAFRISDNDGIVGATTLSGTPYLLEFESEEPMEEETESVANTKKSKKEPEFQLIHYRVPAICNVKLTDGEDTIFSGRFPVYQYGSEETFPIYNITNPKTK